MAKVPDNTFFFISQ